MSRLRITLSSSPLDREIAKLVHQAERSLHAALKLCEQAAVTTPEARRRVAATRRDLTSALGALGSVRRTQPAYDTTDSDLSVSPEPRAPKLTPPMWCRRSSRSNVEMTDASDQDQ